MATPFEQALAAFHGGDLARCEQMLRRGLAKDARDGEMSGLLAVVLSLTGQYPQAKFYFEQALRLRPDSASLRCNYGSMLVLQGESEAADKLFGEALEMSPDMFEALVGRCATRHAVSDADGSLAAGRRAVEINPRDQSARVNLASSLTAAGCIAEAKTHQLAALRMKAEKPGLITNYLMTLHYDPDASAEAISREHREWGARLGEFASRGVATGAPRAAAPVRVPPMHEDRGPRGEPGGRKLRVGYVTSDLRGHVVARFVEGLFAQHDRSRFEIFAYMTGRSDATTKRFAAMCDRFVDAKPMSDEALLAKMRSDELDVAVDLNGHTEGNRLAVFARRAAPVQVTYLGYPNITGVPNMDWRLVDRWSDPEDTGEFGVGAAEGTERLWRLDRCGWCFTPWADAPAVSPLPATAAGHVTFGSFNACPKINDRVLALWARVLAAVPGSRLWIKNRGLNSREIRERTQRGLSAGLKAAGVGEGAMSRVELSGWDPTPGDHFGQYRRVDIALDSYPYHGTTTTCEALWAGVPVVSLAGRTHVSRVGASLLRAVGLESCVATDDDAFVAIAAKLAGDLPALAALRAGLRGRMAASELGDAKDHARAVEAALMGMWNAARSVRRS